MTPAGTQARLERLLRAYDLPTQMPDGLSAQALVETMALDKKAEGSSVRVVLLTDIGACTAMPLERGQLARLL